MNRDTFETIVANTLEGERILAGVRPGRIGFIDIGDGSFYSVDLQRRIRLLVGMRSSGCVEGGILSKNILKKNRVDDVMIEHYVFSRRTDYVAMYEERVVAGLSSTEFDIARMRGGEQLAKVDTEEDKTLENFVIDTSEMIARMGRLVCSDEQD